MPIENSELNRFGDVRRLDCVGVCQVGDCPRHAEDPYVRSCRQSEPIVGRFKQTFSFGIDPTPTFRLTSVNLGV
jgi:hypothetical protein